ncbi:MAG: DUF59 domain-containing protein [Gemmatimonadetes bacterium]|nr:DUF59 domain-containing protein [Gemmatimonadota bacterium]MBT5059521.1 DUF59 domain-containing protein [Gemmatimonadota bacterium]MBT5590043.1 DUF59 domain-containing protein [Gemmatimonadota bacterium]MBT5960099.1 DUF59 domain-containing protein [Gemmatimonadota bacterium]MBT6627736.1 DUF59 domain-containing protein [Gemmatimonadota bacterium]
MSPYRRNLEPTRAERTDDVETKIEILRRALAEGNHELALGVATSIKEGVEGERTLLADPGSADVLSSNWCPVVDLPNAWADWAAGWALYQCLRVSESIGQARGGEPVDLLVELPFDQVMSPGRELRVARVDREAASPTQVTSQVYGVLRRGTSWFARLVFEADVPASGDALYLVFCGNPAAELPDYPSRMQVSGEGAGLQIETPDYVAKLCEQNGQLESLTPKWHTGGMQLASHGNGHGEPPNIDWAHDYMSVGPFQKMRVTNWDQCPSLEVIRGPLCTIVRRFGFPHSPAHPLFTPSRLFMDLSYTFYAGVPYFMKDGHMEVTRDFCTLVARDDEWYFGGRPFDSTLWMDAEGHVYEGKPPEDNADHMWGVGFFHGESRDSMFAIYLDHRLEKPTGSEGDESGSAALGPEGTTPAKLYHHVDMTVDHAKPGSGPHASVWCRPMLRDNAWLQRGTTLVQRNAYLLAPYPAQGGAAGLQQLRERLLAPLVVRVEPLKVALYSDPSAGTDPPDRGTSLPDDGVGRLEGDRPLARIGERAADWPRKQALWEVMREVIDDQFSEKKASLVDLGYIYDVHARGNDVRVLMTMPHRGRPKFEFLAKPLRTRLEQEPDVRAVVVDFTWEPAWTANLLTDVGRAKLGLGDAPSVDEPSS